MSTHPFAPPSQPVDCPCQRAFEEIAAYLLTRPQEADTDDGYIPLGPDDDLPILGE